MDSLLVYLESFYERTHPLVSLSKQHTKVKEMRYCFGQRLQMLEEFDRKWEAGEILGWEDRGCGNSISVQNVRSVIDLDAFVDVDDLETVGPERLKQALRSLGLKCGGTTRQRAERLYSLKGHSLEVIDVSLFAKGREAVSKL